MLFLCDTRGNITAAIPDALHQGSIGVNKLVLLAPFPSTTVVTATFTLPNGIKLYPKYVGKDELEASDYPYIMAAVEAFTGKLPVIDGVSLNVWQLTLDKAITQVAGNVTVQFLFTGSDGTLTSSNATLPVGRGNAYLAPNVSENDINTISAYLQRAEVAALNAEEDAEAAEAAKEKAEEAQAAAEEAQAGAEEAATNAANEALLPIIPRLEYDHVITTEEQLEGLPNLAGRVLIDGVTLTGEHVAEFDLNQGCYKLHLHNINTGAGVALNGNSYCHLTASGSMSGPLSLRYFGSVEGVLAVGYFVQLLECRYISKCIISEATLCNFIDNCFVIGSNNPDYTELPAFNECKYICGISFMTGAPGVVEFNHCSYVSNIECQGKYKECTYVDADTCQGFVSDADVGKVHTITKDGSFEVKDLPQGVNLVYDSALHKFKVQITDSHGKLISESEEIDLPLESLIVSGSVSKDGKTLTLTLKNSETIDIPVENIVKGLATKEQVEAKVREYSEYSVVLDSQRAIDGFHEVCTRASGEGVQAYSGNILVKNVEDIPYFDISAACNEVTSVTFVNCSSYGGISGNGAATLRGLHFNTGTVEKFAVVEFCTGAASYANCTNIRHSQVYSVVNCDYVSDVTTFAYDTSHGFTRCKQINGVRIDAVDDVMGYNPIEFNECEHVSNVVNIGNALVQYINCAHVEAETCDGFVPDDAVGKVRVLTQDGSFEAVPIPTGTFVDVVELPEADAREDCIYRRLTGTVMFNGASERCALHCVNGLPETGYPVTDVNMSYIQAYYNVIDEAAYGYLDSTLASVMGVSAGWYSLGTLLEANGIPYGGIITDINDSTPSIQILLGYQFYYYKGVMRALGTSRYRHSIELYIHAASSPQTLESDYDLDVVLDLTTRDEEVISDFASLVKAISQGVVSQVVGTYIYHRSHMGSTSRYEGRALSIGASNLGLKLAYLESQYSMYPSTVIITGRPEGYQDSFEVNIVDNVTEV